MLYMKLKSSLSYVPGTSILNVFEVVFSLSSTVNLIAPSDAVIDNSGRDVDWVKQSATLLKDNCDLYLYTSSTGVYNPYLKSDYNEEDKVLLTMPEEFSEEEKLEYEYGIIKANSNLNLKNATSIIASCRMIKSLKEISIMQYAMNITLEVQKAVARIMRVGISAAEVVDFINEAHKRYGIESGSYFCIVLFGVDSSFPHGVRMPKKLEMNDVVLVDTGCVLHDYISDITRTYVFGEVNDEQRRIWNIEKEAQINAR